MAEKSERIRICSLWRNTAKDGTSYLMGSFTFGTKLLVYPNKYKKTDKDPDYVVSIVPKDGDANSDVKAEFPDLPF